jgi:DNA-binding ferritin-like protein
MTQEEFYLKAMLAMASNPNYVKVEKCEDDPSVTTHMLLTEEIQMDAERLLKEAQDSWIEAFDKRSDKTTNDILNSIADDISELNKYGIKTFPEES